MALLLVLGMVALLSVMIVNFGSDEGIDIELAYNFRDSVQAQNIAMGAVQAAIAVLKDDDASHDSKDEPWGVFDRYIMGASKYLEDNTMEASIVDESGKIDLNALAKNDAHRDFRIAQFQRLFTLLHVDITDEESRELAYAVIDWVDEDSETELGAEDDYYMSLEPPYRCKNAPMDSPEEILMVKGMKREYFFGTKDYEGIQKYVTVGTDGRINVNTASETVLMSLSDEFGENVVAGILDCRPFESDDLKCISAIDLSGARPESTWLKETLVVKSSRFSVNVRAQTVSGAEMNVKAVLERVNNSPRIVYYKIN
jgi:general secretion pathway protein K